MLLWCHLWQNIMPVILHDNSILLSDMNAIPTLSHHSRLIHSMKPHNNKFSFVSHAPVCFLLMFLKAHANYLNEFQTHLHVTFQSQWIGAAQLNATKFMSILVHAPIQWVFETRPSFMSSKKTRSYSVNWSKSVNSNVYIKSGYCLKFSTAEFSERSMPSCNQTVHIFWIPLYFRQLHHCRQNKIKRKITLFLFWMQIRHNCSP